MGIVRKYRKRPVVVEAYQTEVEMIIPTLEGDHHASPVITLSQAYMASSTRASRIFSQRLMSWWSERHACRIP